MSPATPLEYAMVRKIHIFGASGAGSTTLGSEVEKRLGFKHIDSDDYLWSPSELPYQTRRTPGERSSLLLADLDNHDQWVLSGSICDWGDQVIPYFDLAVYLWVPTDVRLKRLRLRESAKIGDLVAKGGVRETFLEDFLDWASRYDVGDENMRSNKMHCAWMNTLPCKVVRIVGERELDEKIDIVKNSLNEIAIQES